MTLHSTGHHPQCLWDNYVAVSLFSVAEVRRFAVRRVDRSHVATSLPTFAPESFKFYVDPIKARKKKRENGVLVLRLILVIHFLFFFFTERLGYGLKDSEVEPRQQ
jgi:hypothetical protein